MGWSDREKSAPVEDPVETPVTDPGTGDGTKPDSNPEKIRKIDVPSKDEADKQIDDWVEKHGGKK